MSDPQSNNENPDGAPQELTPEARALLKRARRSFGISIGFLLLGFMAIGGVLVYRATRDKPSEVPVVTSSETGQLALPPGAEIVSAVATGGLVTVTYKLGETTQLRLFDEKTGTMVRQMDVVTEK